MSGIPANFTDGTLTLTDNAAHSETLDLSMGDLSISGLVPDGRALDVVEARGHVVGARKGARARPTLSVSGVLHDPSEAFIELAFGITSGFTSTTADIGDYAANDLDFSFDYSSESRDITADDVVLTGVEISEGSPSSTISFTFEILGPLEIDGKTVISAR